MTRRKGTPDPDRATEMNTVQSPERSANTSMLERSARRWLRAYPPAYRAEHGGEIVGTLLDAASAGRAAMPLRDAYSLLIGGLRVRAAQHRRQSVRTGLRLSALLGFALALALTAGGTIGGVSRFLGWDDPGAVWPDSPAYTLVVGLLTLAALGAIWFASWRIALPVGLAAAVAMAFPWYGPWTLVGPAVMIGTLALSRGRPRPQRGWYVLLVLAAATQAADEIAPQLAPSAQTVVRLVQFAVLAGVLLWAAVDVRPLAATTVFLLVLEVPGLVSGYANGASPGITSYWPMGIALLPGIVAAWRLRRQAVL